MSHKSFDWKYIGLFVLLCLATLSAYIFKAQLIYSLRCFFQFPGLNLLAGSIATIITVTHKIKTRQFTFSPTMSFNEFKIPVEALLSFISNPITIVCALSLAKGLFLQTSEDVAYFPFFNGIEMIFVAIITAYLLFISIMELAKHFMEIINKSDTKTVVPKAISEKEFNESKG